MKGFAVNIPSWEHTPEDSFLLDEQHGVAAAFDGLAGHGHGDLASQLAAETLYEHLPVPGEPSGWSVRAIDACREALKAARRSGPVDQMSMTTTAVIGWLQDDGRYEIAWCGDSRAYLINATGHLRQLTQDHDFLFSQVEGGLIGAYRAQSVRGLLGDVQSASEAWHAGGALAKKAYKRKHIMCSELSGGVVGFTEGELSSGEVLMLCSDGVHDNLTLTGMRALAADHSGPQALAQAMAAAAERRARDGEGDAHVDDITCLTLSL